MVSVATVVQAPMIMPTPFGGASEQVAIETVRIQDEIAARTVGQVSRRLAEAGFETEPVVLSGRTADRLLDLIGREQFDLVVVGSGNKGTLEAFVLGSVARKLVLYSPSSVLIGRKFENGRSFAKESDKTGKINVLVGVDGSTNAQMAIDSLANVKRGFFGNVYTLSVCEFSPFGLEAVDSFNRETEIAEQAAFQVAGIAESVTPLALSGAPAKVIVDTAKNHHVDLIVLGAGRHGVIERLMLGSTAYDVATKAPCSVLILRQALALGETNNGAKSGAHARA